MADEAQTGRPSAESRRQQILDASCDQVRRSGFHGASMADIAKAAGLSVGQIYRYFENKEAIIAAIVAQDLAEMREKFAELESQPGTLLDAIGDHLPDGIDKCFDPLRAPLVLEVLAEAARNPKVAAIVRAADAQERMLGRSMLERSRNPDWSDAEFEVRGEVLGMLFDGMVMRGVNHPDIDRAMLAKVMQGLIGHLLT